LHAAEAENPAAARALAQVAGFEISSVKILPASEFLRTMKFSSFQLLLALAPAALAAAAASAPPRNVPAAPPPNVLLLV